MAIYRFVTVWRLAAPQQAVWDALFDVAGYGTWWPAMVGFVDRKPGVTGVGAHHEQVVRGPLPYNLRYETVVTRCEPPRELAYDAAGDLEGDGRMLVAPDGDQTVVTFHWNVRTRGFWMNVLSPLLKRLFAWNHNHVMSQGERGLTQFLSQSQRP